jgi:hypothetical protein
MEALKRLILLWEIYTLNKGEQIKNDNENVSIVYYFKYEWEYHDFIMINICGSRILDGPSFPVLMDTTCTICSF